MPKDKTTSAFTARESVLPLLPPLTGRVTVNASAAQSYAELCERFDSVIATIHSERVGLLQQLQERSKVVTERATDLEACQLRISDAERKIGEVEGLIASRSQQDEQKVAAAQAEFDRAILGDDESAQKAAEKLHAARSQQQVGSIMQNGLRLRLQGHQSTGAQLRQEEERMRAAWLEAWDDVRASELELAQLDSDEAMNRALACYLRLRQAQQAERSAAQPRFLQGVGGASFWFSAPHRVVQWNPMLSSGGDRKGPVAIAAHALERLVGQVLLPAGAVETAVETAVEQEAAQ